MNRSVAHKNVDNKPKISIKEIRAAEAYRETCVRTPNAAEARAIAKWGGNPRAIVLNIINTYARQGLQEVQDVFPDSLISGTCTEEKIVEWLRREGITIRWVSGSKAPGPDFYFVNFPGKMGGQYSVSVKSGVIKLISSILGFLTAILEFSGSRTGKFKTLSEKIIFGTGTSPDLYVSVATFSGVKNSTLTTLDKFNFVITIFEGTKVNYGETTDWVKKGKKWLRIANDHEIVINGPSLSDQIWTKLDITDADTIVVPIVRNRRRRPRITPSLYVKKSLL